MLLRCFVVVIIILIIITTIIIIIIIIMIIIIIVIIITKMTQFKISRYTLTSKPNLLINSKTSNMGYLKIYRHTFEQRTCIHLFFSSFFFLNLR